MAIRPNNLTPRPSVRTPDTLGQLNGNIVNPPTYPTFGGAKAVSDSVKRAPYGKIAHVGRRGQRNPG